MYDDDSWFTEEETADGILTDVPKGGDLGNREMPFEVGRVVVRDAHSQCSRFSNDHLRRCDALSFFSQLLFESRCNGR